MPVKTRRKMTRRMTGQGAKLQKLKKWAGKALDLIKKHGPGLARKYKLGSRGLDYAAKSFPKYGSALTQASKMAGQAGYGRRSVMRSRGRGLRSAGAGMRCRKH
jgi:hypothetical protein